jgi:two-component system, OmpR family, catabolic regulation response regulator CreB
MSLILIVEDELAIAEALQLALHKEGHRSEIQGFGELALERISAPDSSYALVILDVGLPDLSGFEVCRRLRRTHSAERLPVLFLTAHNEEIDRIMGLELGGGDYLTKPFSLRELVTRIRLLLGRRLGNSSTLAALTSTNDLDSTTRPMRKDYLDFEWDEQELWASFRQQKLTLTLTEYKLLLTFLAHPKQVFSRQQLIDGVRGETHPSGPRTIDTHIKSLRFKLRQLSPEADIIVTHRGIGYSSH